MANTDLSLSYDQTRGIIDDLWSWSANYQFPTPASLFLDLIGYSADEFGEPLCSAGAPMLGYHEHHLLGWALLAHAHRPSAVLERVTELLTDEAEAA
jgi:hypothetical protein